MTDKPTSNLAVLIFEGQDTAQVLYEQIEQMQKEKLVSVEDAIILEYESGGTQIHVGTSDAGASQFASTPVSTESGSKVTVKQTRGKKGKYAAIGGGIGLLAGAIFGGPIGLATIGAAGVGAIVGALRDFGIDDKSVQAVKQRLRPNTSALLVLGHANDRDAFLAKLREYDAQVVMTSLDPEVERELVAKLESKA
jgi:uncharacterized membrane protein